MNLKNKWIIAFTTTSLVSCFGGDTEKNIKPIEKKKVLVSKKGSIKTGSWKIGFNAKKSLGVELATKDYLENLNSPEGVSLFTNVKYNNPALNFEDLEKYNLSLYILNSEDKPKSSFYDDLKSYGKNVLLVGENSKGPTTKPYSELKNVTTGNYSLETSAYISGFQVAVNEINYLSDDKKLEKTNISFLIGSLNESKYKKAAVSFKEGVLAAIANSKYSELIIPSFVKANDYDDTKTTAKLNIDLADWKESGRFLKYLKADSFADSDARVIYIAGLGIKDLNQLTAKSSKKANIVIDNLETIKGKKFDEYVLDNNKNNNSNLDVRYTFGTKEQAKEHFVGRTIEALFYGNYNYFLNKHTDYGSLINFVDELYNDKKVRDEAIDNFYDTVSKKTNSKKEKK